MSSVAQVELLRPAVEADHGEVDPVGALEVGGGEEVGHQALDVDPVRARRDHQAGRVLVIRLVAQVLDHRQLLRLHLGGDLRQHLAARDLIGERGDHHVAVLHLPRRRACAGSPSRSRRSAGSPARGVMISASVGKSGPGTAS